MLIVLGLIGVLQGDFIGGIWRFLVGMFLRGAASASYGETLARRLLTDIPVARIMSADTIVVTPDLSVQDFIDDYVYRSTLVDGCQGFAMHRRQRAAATRTPVPVQGE